GQLLRHDERTGIVPSVRVQQLPGIAKQGSICSGDAVPAVLACNQKLNRRCRWILHRLVDPTSLPAQIGKLSEDVARADAPLFAQRGEVGITLVESATHLDLEGIPLVTD